MLAARWFAMTQLQNKNKDGKQKLGTEWRYTCALLKLVIRPRGETRTVVHCGQDVLGGQKNVPCNFWRTLSSRSVLTFLDDPRPLTAVPR